jgi:hypothetical protein
VGDPVLINIDPVRAVESEAFVGRVLVGDIEVYRTVGEYATPDEAVHATAGLLAGVLGPRLAGQEWNTTKKELHRVPLREDLRSGASDQPTES